MDPVSSRYLGKTKCKNTKLQKQQDIFVMYFIIVNIIQKKASLLGCMPKTTTTTKSSGVAAGPNALFSFLLLF